MSGLCIYFCIYILGVICGGIIMWKIKKNTKQFIEKRPEKTEVQQPQHTVDATVDKKDKYTHWPEPDEPDYIERGG